MLFTRLLAHLEACTQMLRSLVGKQLDEQLVLFILQKVWKALLHSFQIDAADDLLARLSDHGCCG